MHLGKVTGNLQIRRGSTYLLQKSCVEKDLGIWIDKAVKFSEHIAHATSKAN